MNTFGTARDSRSQHAAGSSRRCRPSTGLPRGSHRTA